MSNALRRDLDAFLGRDDELRSILETAGPSRTASIITVDGMPGIGKTALVTRAAHRLAGAFPDGRFFVELHAHTPGRNPAAPDDVLGSLLNDLGIEPRDIPGTMEGRRNLWRDRLADKRILLVLDDVADHAQIEPLLPAGPRCLTLITSRRRLVALDCAVPLSLGILAPDAAAELFLTLARRPAAADERSAVAEITRLCGYLPLAIVLLAGRLAHHTAWTIDGLAAQFASARDRLDELDAGYGVALHAAFTMSFRELPPARRRLFQRVSLHPGTDFDTLAAAALDDSHPATTARELEALYTDHLIEETARGRYKMHDLLREFARTMSAADPPTERADAVGRLLDHYRRAAHSAEHHLAFLTRPMAETTPDPAPTVVIFPVIADRADALAWMRTERTNLQACLEYAARHDQPERMVDLANALASFLDQNGPWPDAIDLHGRAVEAARRAGYRLGEAVALNELGRMRELTGDYRSANVLQEEALTIYRAIGNRLGQANTLNDLARLSRLSGRRHTVPGQQEAMAIYLELGDRRGEANTLNDLGRAHRLAGNLPAAESLHREALRIYRKLGHHLGEAFTHYELGRLREEAGDDSTAMELYELARTISCRSDIRLGEAVTCYRLGRIHEKYDQKPTATDLFQSALADFRGVDCRPGEAYTLLRLARIRQADGDLPGANELCRQALDAYPPVGSRLIVASASSPRRPLHKARLRSWPEILPLLP